MVEQNTYKFNGGKMDHIFVPGKGKYEEGFSSPEAEACFLNPQSKATLKTDGACCMLWRQDNKWVFCERQDNYKGGEQTIPI
jgi:hypothetical protein